MGAVRFDRIVYCAGGKVPYGEEKLNDAETFCYFPFHEYQAGEFDARRMTDK